MSRRVIHIVVLVGFVLAGKGAPTQSRVERVRIEATKRSAAGSLLHWKISNDSDTGVFVYDVFLWGPAYSVQRSKDRIAINTSPITEIGGCPPNRYPLILLLVVGPHRSIEGDFADDNIKDLAGKVVSIRVAVGSDPYSVVDEAKRFANSGCQHSPWDAIVRWGTILESNSIGFPASN
jgi:hypothetical protein